MRFLPFGFHSSARLIFSRLFHIFALTFRFKLAFLFFYVSTISLKTLHLYFNSYVVEKIMSLQNVG